MVVFKKGLKLQLFSHHQNIRSNNKIKICFSKWDNRSIAAITAVLVFLGLLTLVVVNIIVIEDDNDSKISSSNSNSSEVSKQANFFSASATTKCNGVADGSLSCSNMESGNLVAAINDWLKENYRSEKTKLELREIQFANGLMEQGWLDGVEMTISEITLSSTKIINFGPKSFSGPALENLQTLTLSIAKTEFKRDIFDGSNIVELQIWCSDNLHTFEENALGALSQSLGTLQIQGCIKQNDGLTNITDSSDTFSALTKLDLRQNTLGKLKSSTFRSAPGLHQLYLGGCQIEEIEAGTFNSGALNMLDLTTNNLRGLPEGIFDFVRGGISIAGNKWLCDCNLLWLKKMFDNMPDNFFVEDDFDCATDEGPKVYYLVDFCNETEASTPTGEPVVTTSSSSITIITEEPVRTTSTSSPTTITDTTSTTTIPSPEEVLQVPCRNYRTTNFKLEYAEVIKIRNETVSMCFYQHDNTYILQVTGNINADNLLWINAEDKTQQFCVKDLGNGKQYELSDIIPGETYIFCAIPSGQETISPLDCAAKSFVSEENLPLISHKDLIPFICGICASFLAAILITALIVFYCIRQHPSLIKGNKRVVIVENEAVNAVVMPKYYDRISYKAPSLNSCSNGYLTPRRDEIYIPSRPASLRTISENAPFVIPPVTTRGGRMRRSRRNDSRRTCLEHIMPAFDEHVYEPPPLPPNHPSGLNFKDSFVLRATYSHV